MLILAASLIVLAVLYLIGSTSPVFHPERVVVSTWGIELSNELDTMARHEELAAAATLEDTVDAEWTRIHFVRVVSFDRAQAIGRKVAAAYMRLGRPATSTAMATVKDVCPPTLRCPVYAMA